MENLKKATIASALALITACMATGPKMNPELGTPISLQTSEFFNAEKLQDSSSSVVVITGNKDENVEYGTAFATLVSATLGDNGIRIEDRNVAQKAKDEILLASFQTGATYSGPKSADFALITYIDTINYSGEYKPSSSYTSDGKTKYTDPECKYTYSFKGRVEVRNMPDLSMKKLVRYDEEQTNYVKNPPSRRCSPNATSVLMGVKDVLNESLLRGDSTKDLMTILSSKYYITEAYQFEDDIFYKTNLGIGKGAKEGREVNLFVEKSNGDLLFFGTGEFLSNNYANEKSSYIKVDSDVRDLVKRGTVLQIVGNEGCGWSLACQLNQNFKL